MRVMRMRDRIRNIYMIGICGVAMGSLAGMLKERGYAITGSDEHVYPPMSSMLEQWGIAVHDGFDASNVGSPDCVIIGNAVSRGNPEAEYVLNRGIPYMSMAHALHEFFLSGSEVIAVAGTHGKTTTTALLAHILEIAGLSPSFFVGGVPVDYNSNYRLGGGKYFVIEGDEYDSAFFEKLPKFIMYRPRHLILTSLEFDHADIYSDIDEITLWFSRLVNIVPSEGRIVFSAEYPRLFDAVKKSHTPCYTFAGSGAEFNGAFVGYDGNVSTMLFSTVDGVGVEMETPLFGHFNYMNITAAAAMAMKLGVDIDVIRDAVRTFRGVRRRQELIYSGDGIRIFEDFAHHPTAIRSVLGMMRGRFPGSRIWAVYEPRSATSRRNVFQAELPAAFADANTVMISRPYRLEAVPEGQRIDIDAIIADVQARGGDAALYEGADEIVDAMFDRLDRSEENIIVIMSNGGFGGIYEKMIARAGHTSC